MKRLFTYVTEASIALLLLAIPAHAEMAAGPLPRNISIEVEFKETGFRTKKIRGLPPHQRRKENQYTKQHIVVSDGLTATIRVGEDVPYVEYYTAYLTDHGYVEEIQTEWREVGTKLAVTPKIRGNYIEVALTPQVSYISGGRRNVINVKEVATTVLIANGQSMSIGGLLKDRDFSGNFFKTESSSNLDIILTPRIQ